MVKCKRVESTRKQSLFVEHSYSLKKKNHLSFVEACFRRTQNLSTIDQEKQKIQQIYIWNPFNHCQFNYVNIDFTSRVWNFCCLGTDIPPGKTSLAAILCRNSSNLQVTTVTPTLLLLLLNGGMEGRVQVVFFSKIYPI